MVPITSGVLTEEEVKEAILNHDGVIHYRHQGAYFDNYTVFHPLGTLYVSGAVSLEHLSCIGSCHALVSSHSRNSRISRFDTPRKGRVMTLLLGVDGYALDSVNNRVYLRRKKVVDGFRMVSRALWVFRKTPSHWIDWKLFITTLNIGGYI